MNRIQARIFLYSMLTALLLFCPAVVAAKNLHLIESLPNGFAIYRSGTPSEKDLAEFSELGIQEIAVLSGNAQKHELKHREVFPDLVIVYDEKQNHKEPLTEAFLDWFDKWVERSRREGMKIAIRCKCGCHRTGRLAAYYQMKWQNLTYEDATIIMGKHGKHMSRYKHLWDQVRGLAERIEGQGEVMVRESG